MSEESVGKTNFTVAIMHPAEIHAEENTQTEI